jgi:FKBP-type peptidyl-prolyl cis-trans isomerase FkpA
MEPRRVRLSLEGLENRETPATLADVSAAAAQTQANAAVIRAIAADPRWMANPAFRPAVVGFAQGLFRQGTAAVTVMQDARATMSPLPAQVGPTEALARSNSAVATRIANWLGFPVVPTPVRPRPPADAGMTNVMPPANSPSWVTQANGLRTWDVVQGTGDPVAAGDSITVFYSGWLVSNGTRFDARRSPSPPATFSLNGLIQGWQQGIPGMRPGGIRRLFVPAALGYGATGSPPNIPPNADLIFEIKMISHT